MPEIVMPSSSGYRISETSLRDWLNEYETAAQECSQAFDLRLRVSNARNGVHADAVMIVLDLPATLNLCEDRPNVPLPPQRPCYCTSCLGRVRCEPTGCTSLCNASLLYRSPCPLYRSSHPARSPSLRGG